jgi:hypothetical protein
MSEENAVREPAIDKSSGTVYSWAAQRAGIGQ